jgi:hypothetical protein
MSERVERITEKLQAFLRENDDMTPAEAYGFAIALLRVLTADAPVVDRLKIMESMHDWLVPEAAVAKDAVLN